ncbi:MAG: amidase [Sandaracinaceae bacterium]
MFSLPPSPRLSGPVLRSAVAAASADPVRRALAAMLRRDLGIDEALALPAALRDAQPLHARPTRARSGSTRRSSTLGEPAPPTALASAASWTAAYREGHTDPVEVLDRVLAEQRRLATATPTMACFCALVERAARRDAEASRDRWARHAPLGPLDGVVVPIKEELDLDGLGYRLGTAFIPPSEASADAVSVARLRAAGAILIGHTPMTEFGLSPLGVNPHRDMPRNVHHKGRLAGGSSTGTAVAVSCGLAPVGMGSDAGGSIRVPAAFNGVFGLKPTFGRVSRTGDGFDGSMSHLGPLGASARDLAVFLEACSGVDPADELTHAQPALGAGELVDALGRGVAGLRIGVLEGELDAAEYAVARSGRDALRALADEGAELVPVEVELAPHAPAMGYLTIGFEAMASLLHARRDHWELLGADLQLLVRALEEQRGESYVDVQCLRAALRRQVAEALREVDVLALPTTVDVAPAIKDAEHRSGISDTGALHAACRFAMLGNLTGLPAGTAPVGQGDDGLPVGLQIVGDAWDEASVLQVLAHLERIGVAQVREARNPVHPLGA